MIYRHEALLYEINSKKKTLLDFLSRVKEKRDSVTLLNPQLDTKFERE